MKILVDMQAAQSDSRHRGIGRYSRAFLEALVRNGPNHEVHVSMSGALGNTAEELRHDLRDILPPDRLRTFQVLSPNAESNENNLWKARASQLLRESFNATLKPDVTHTSSLFEGRADEAVLSIGRLPSTGIQSVTHYDLIPHADPERYLPSPLDKKWYADRLDSLHRADLLLAISEFARREAIDALNLSEDRVVAIHADADPIFCRRESPSHLWPEFREKLGIDRPFVLFTGVIADQDPRKNCGGLLRAYAELPSAVRAEHKLVLVGSVHGLEQLEASAERLGLQRDEWITAGRVSDEELVQLYNACKLFVFPSTHEGFGLPVLEAMRCGAPVIASDVTSIPEVVGSDRALFDPLSTTSISTKMHDALTNESFRNELRDLATRQAKEFSWDRTAKLAIAAFEETHGKTRPRSSVHVPIRSKENEGAELVNRNLISALVELEEEQPSQKDLEECARAVGRNSIGAGNDAPQAPKHTSTRGRVQLLDPAKHTTKQLVRWSIQRVLRHPTLKLAASTLLDVHPELKERLRAISSSTGTTTSQPADELAVNGSHSQEAQRIYQELRSAIARRQSNVDVTKVPD